MKDTVNSTDAEVPEAEAEGDGEAETEGTLKGESIYEMNVEDAPITTDVGIEVWPSFCSLFPRLSFCRPLLTLTIGRKRCYKTSGGRATKARKEAQESTKPAQEKYGLFFLFLVHELIFSFLLLSFLLFSFLFSCFPASEISFQNLVGAPYNVVHKSHVNFDYQWTGDAVAEAFEMKEKIGQGYLSPPLPSLLPPSPLPSSLSLYL